MDDLVTEAGILSIVCAPLIFGGILGSMLL